MIRAGIIGSAGYTGGELIRLMIHHSEVDISFAQSTSQAGTLVSHHHGDLAGETDLLFSDDFHFDIDVLFLCGGHGKSEEFLSTHQVPETVRIIDLSTDFRIGSKAGFVYGLPELNINEIKKAQRIANPGCFATAIQLGLLPLAKSHLLIDDVHVNAITGSTGAGAGLSSTSHFSRRNNNISIYKPFSHQHLEEINQSVLKLQGDFIHSINFLPVRGNFTRGIYASLYTQFDGNLEDAREIYSSFYEDASFTHLVTINPDLKQVVNTNKCLIYLEIHQGKLLIISILDNLLKGASGQAIQNMNLMFGLEETSGLHLKATGF